MTGEGIEKNREFRGRITELLSPQATLALAGMCKNAGKTTVLNRVLAELAQEGKTVALTSIGRDGETEDVATGTHKPRIYVEEGTVFATASGLLANCDTSTEILALSGVSTPMGEVVLCRARSGGFLDLAGPSMNQQLVALSEQFRQFGPDKILVDGAISRKSLCSRRVADEVILCTGASYHRDVDVVVSDTAYIAELLQLPEASGELSMRQPGRQNSGCPGGLDEGSFREAWRDSLIRARREAGEGNKLLVFAEDGTWRAPGRGERLVDVLRDKRWQGCRYFWLEGAVTDALLRPLLLSNVPLEGRVFVAEDSSKLLLGEDTYRKLGRKGGRMRVLWQIHLRAVTVNPFSAYGNHFDRKELKEKMQAAVELPVLDVKEEKDDFVDL